MAKEGRTTVYNLLTSKEKMAQVNPVNLELEDDFMAYLEASDKSRRTIDQYRSNLHIFWCYNLEHNNNKEWPKVTQRELLRWQGYCVKPKDEGGCGWSPNRIISVKAALSSLSNFIMEYMDDEYPNYNNVVKRVRNPIKVPVRKKTIYVDDDIKIMLDELIERKEYMKACLLALACYSGRRKSELVRFKVSYFSDENLICEGALYQSPEEIVTKGRGSRGKMLTVYTLAKQFKPYFEFWMDEREKLGVATDWLFPHMVNGEYVDEQMPIRTVDQISRYFNEMSERLCGKSFYPHAMRHYFTTKLSSCNIPATVIQDIVGWESADMVTLYDDSPPNSKFDKYFGAEGIKKVGQNSLVEI